MSGNKWWCTWSLTNSQTIVKNTLLKSILYDYSDEYILAKGTITALGQSSDAAAMTADRNDKGVIFENHAHFFST